MDESRSTNGIIRVRLCIGFQTFLYATKNNENIPYNLITNKKYICKENVLLL